jgi:hypothetical protein
VEAEIETERKIEITPVMREATAAGIGRDTETDT